MQPRLARTHDGARCPARTTLALAGQQWVPGAEALPPLAAAREALEA